MRALSVRQPWAWAIVNGHKRIENRTWAPRYRGTLLIHASKSKADLSWMRLVGRYTRTLVRDFEAHLAYGAIVGVVRLKEILPPEVETPQPEWSLPGYQHWVFEDAVALREPFPCLGRLQLWRPGEFAADWCATDLALWSERGLEPFPDLQPFLGGQA